MEEFWKELRPVTPGKIPQELSLKKMEMQHTMKVLCNRLVDTFNATMELRSTNKKMYIESELMEFERMFRTGEGTVDWSYLSKRMNLSEAGLEELYKHRFDVINGRHQLVTEYNRDLFLKYGVLLGMLKYMDFLRDYINMPRLYDKYRLVSPDVDERIDLSEEGRLYVKECMQELLLDIDGKDKGSPIMSQEDITYFLGANFKGFTDSGMVPHKLFKTRFKVNEHLARFIYQMMYPLMVRPDCYVTYDQIRDLIIHNFDGFQNPKSTSVERAMRKSSDVTPAPLNRLLLAIKRRKKEHNFS